MGDKSYNMFRAAKSEWVIQCCETQAYEKFLTLDSACDALLTLGVRDEEIDFGIADLLTKKNTRAHFGTQLTFIFSDGESFKQPA